MHGGSFATAKRGETPTRLAIWQQHQRLAGEIGAALFDRATWLSGLKAKEEVPVRVACFGVRIMAEARDVISGARAAGVLRFGASRTVSGRHVSEAIGADATDLSLDLTVRMSLVPVAHVATEAADTPRVTPAATV